MGGDGVVGGDTGPRKALVIYQFFKIQPVMSERSKFRKRLQRQVEVIKDDHIVSMTSEFSPSFVL